MMSYPPSDYGSDPSAQNYSDYETAEEAWRAQKRMASSYIPAVCVALVIGALLGALLGRRRRKDAAQAAKEYAAQAAREWLETAYTQLTEKLPQLVEKLPHPKKATMNWCQEAFLDQAQQVGKKLKWW